MLGRSVFTVAMSLVLFASTALAAPKKAPVAGEERERAKTEYVAGMKHYNLAEYAPALERFKEAYRAYPEPTFLYNIGQCYRQLGQNRDALKAYRAYLNNVSENREAVESIIATLEKAIRQEEERAAAAKEAEQQREKERAQAAASGGVKGEALQVETAPTPSPAKPLYRKGWFWGVVVGAVVVVGVGVGLGVGLTQGGASYPQINAANGTYRF